MANQEVAMLLVQEGNSPKTQWPLVEAKTIIGRDADSDVQINERQISRQHAEIARTIQGYTIRDMGSKNGTFLNGEAVTQEPRLMRNGDEVGIALCAKLTFVEDDATAPVVLGLQQQPAIKMDLAAKQIPEFSSRYLNFSSRRGVSWYAYTKKISQSGIMGDPEKASAEKGERIWKMMIAHMVSLVEDLKNMTLEEIHHRRY